MTSNDYKSLLIGLLPPGAFWSWLKTVKLVLAAWAEEFARIDARMADLVRESDPSQATELLPEWEKEYGLPGACAPLADTVAGRRLAIMGKRVATGGQSVPYYTEVAAAMGYTITITEFRPFTCVSPCTGALVGAAWAYAWRVNVLTAPAGAYEGGICLDLECEFRANKQSHTVVVFNYDALEA